MATQSFVATAPVFQHSQTVSTKTYNYGYYPLHKGDIAPVFQLHQDAFVSIQHFLEGQQPLVVVFYNQLGNQHIGLQHLENVQSQVQQNGGNLIVITSNTSRSFKKAIGQYSNLNVFFDVDNTISELFGLYDDTNPLTNWLSGVEDVNATLPALYVIAPDRNIAYHFVDYQFALFSAASFAKNITEGLLEAVNNVYETYTYLSVRLNKLVS